MLSVVILKIEMLSGIILTSVSVLVLSPIKLNNNLLNVTK
jgi:hypothetical protein